MSQNSANRKLTSISSLSKKGKRYVREVQRSNPSRRVDGGKKSIVIRYPSQKMGFTIQAESRTVEYPFVVQCEHNDDVLEFYDQPIPITIRYTNGNGRIIAHKHTPDFLVIENESIYLVECKERTELESLIKKYPDRYTTDSSGNWHSPAGERAVREYGIGYHVWTPDLLSYKFVRNCDFLFDYVNHEPDASMMEAICKISSFVAENKIILLSDLINETGNADPVYWAIALKVICFDLYENLLCHPSVCYVFIDGYHAKALANSRSRQALKDVSLLKISSGDTVIWDKEEWVILNNSPMSCTLRHETKPIVTLDESDFNHLVEQGHITAERYKSYDDSNILDKLKRASKEYIQRVNQRWQYLNDYLAGKNIPEKEVTERTLRNWHKIVREAESAGMNGYYALFLGEGNRGNTTPRLSDSAVELIKLSIKEDYCHANANSARSAHLDYINRCNEIGIDPVSLKTYRNYISRLPRRDVLKSRHGEKYAYQNHAPDPVQEEDFFSPPVHGDRPFEVAHADHTELDIVLISEWTGECIGKPWLSILIDAFTRIVLAFWLTFEKPSHRSLMMLSRRCVQRHKRLPSKIVSDHGSEFDSVYYESFLASYRTSKIERKKGQPRDGSIVERNVGTINTQVLYNLQGNTQARKHGRAMSSTHDPEKHAIWTPDDFHNLLEEYLFSVYPHQPHQGVLEHPADRMAREIINMGSRKHTFIAYDETFIRQTTPPVSGGKPPGTRRIRDNSVKVDHILYSGPSLHRHHGETVDVLSDPFDVRYVYAYVDNHWQKLYTTNALVRACLEREIMSAHMEIFGRGRKSGREYRKSNKKILNFLSDIKRKEQRLFDQKQANLFPAASQNNAETPSIAIVEESTVSEYKPKHLPISYL